MKMVIIFLLYNEEENIEQDIDTLVQEITLQDFKRKKKNKSSSLCY